MKLYISKCKNLTICKNKQKAITYDYSIDIPGLRNESLERVLSIKDLGVVVETDLSFSTHVQEKIICARKMLGIINRNFRSLDKDSFLCLYKSLVRSQLDYCSSVWNPFKKG